MTKKEVPTYHPLLESERSVLGRKANLIDQLRKLGVSGCTRMGEEYIATCRCGGYLVTSHDKTLADFQDEHNPHREQV